jgi:hypothetical protein
MAGSEPWLCTPPGHTLSGVGFAFRGLGGLGFVAGVYACGSGSGAGVAALDGAAGAGQLDATADTSAGGSAGGASDSSSGGSAGVDAGSADARAELAALCPARCEKTLSANCSQDPSLAGCLSGCETYAQVYAHNCATELAAYWNCQIGTASYVCATDAGYSLEKGCASQAIAWWACGVCNPLPEATPCTSCAKQLCCPEWKALVMSPTYAAFYACSETCQTLACLTSCYSPIEDADDDLDSCEASNCSSEC